MVVNGLNSPAVFMTTSVQVCILNDAQQCNSLMETKRAPCGALFLFRTLTTREAIFDLVG